MSRFVRIKLQGDPPPWATREQSGFFSYFENEYGEQWVAKLDGRELVFAGLDVDWKETRLTAKEARVALIRWLEGQATKHPVLTLGNTIVSPAEAMWMAAVIAAVLPGISPPAG